MPKKARELTPLAVSKLKAEGRYAVGGTGAEGLHLRIAGESRAWVLRLAVGLRANASGKPVVHRRDIGLGGYPEVSLAEAREKSRDLRKQVRNGIDPIEAKHEARRGRLKKEAEHERRKTFKECAEAVCKLKTDEVRNAKHAAQWKSTLKTYAYPVLNDGRMIDELTKHDVKAVLEPIWQTKRETAHRLRGRIEAVFDYAKANDAFTGDNPSAWKGALQPLLPRLKKDGKERQPALPHKRVAEFMTALRKREGISPRALEFAILTAARSGEVRGASWGEFDLEARTWTIPASRMKMNREHVVALSDDAIKLLKALPRVKSLKRIDKEAQPEYVFVAPRGGVLSDMTLTAVLRRMHDDDKTNEGVGWTDARMSRVAVVHGFRSTFRDWTAEKGYDRDMAEMALAHSVASNVERAYLRTDMVERRRQLMQDWANYCRSIPECNVVQLKQKAAKQ